MPLGLNTLANCAPIQIESVAPDFSEISPFTFLCNARLDQPAWTPDLIASKLSIFSFGQLQAVSVIATTENLMSHVIDAIEGWNERGYQVHLRFPILKTRPKLPPGEKTFFGLRIGECYIREVDGFHATEALKEAIKKIFKNDRLVRVDTN